MALVLALFFAGCDEDLPAESAATPTPLAIRPLATRLSLQLRGRRPSASELSSLESDPSGLEASVESWMNDPGFEERVLSLYADVYRSRADHYVVGADGDYAFQDETYKTLFIRSVGEEPLRLLAEVAATDRPWTDLVTADWSMGNDYLLAHFPVEPIDPSTTGWRPMRYLDGRPAAGVLTTNGLWWRYTSTTENANRGRAAALSRILLCDTRYERPVDFAKSNATDSVAERIATDPACVGCHVTLDPISSQLYGFWRFHPESYTEALRYYPSRENDWVLHSGVPPSYYGQDVDSIHGLGRAIADDPRFVSCAVEQAWSFFLQRQPTISELDRFNEDRSRFIQGGLTLRALFLAVADDPWFRSDSDAFEGTTPPMRLTPDLLASSVESLTGYRWEVEGGIDAMVNDDFGYRVLNGGVDGILVTEPPSSESATIALVQERLAEAAGPFAVANEGPLALGDRTLFAKVESLDASPTDADLRAQLVYLVEALYGRTVQPDAKEIDSLAALWQVLSDDTGSPASAWGLTLSAMLRHPDFVHY